MTQTTDHGPGLDAVSLGRTGIVDFSDYDPPAPTQPATERESLASDYLQVRRFTHELARPLAIEDYLIQTMREASPAKWHLAHTSWFFERFILHELIPDYEPVHQLYYYLFNSYYNGAGPQHCRAARGLISRPTVEEVYAYRRIIDQRMFDLLHEADEPTLQTLRARLTLGLNHERQHQELLITDIKHVFSSNPLLPAYHRQRPGPATPREPEPWQWVEHAGGLCEIGHAGDGFAFDNERPRHRVFLEPFALASRPLCNAEMLAFIEDGGYERPELWLSEGFATIQERGWAMPIYWFRDGDRWMHYTLAGPQPIDPAEPLAHVSYFEADALARYWGARLPREAEWEIAAGDCPVQGNFAEAQHLHPRPMRADEAQASPTRMLGDLWEWTQSAYSPYPGFTPLQGTLGEYNGKFMCNQYVLRGGSCATSHHHIRKTYRNFFPTDARWQFAGVRVAR